MTSSSTSFVQAPWAQDLVNGDPVLLQAWKAQPAEFRQGPAPAAAGSSSRWLGHLVGRVAGPRWLWALETDVGHRRVFSWNRLRHWDIPYARMALDTRPQHWPALCRRGALDLAQLVASWWGRYPVEHEEFVAGVREGMEAVILERVRTDEPAVVAAMGQAVERIVSGFEPTLDP